MIHLSAEDRKQNVHKSSYSSGSQDNCVECGNVSHLLGDGTFVIGDTQNRDQGLLPFNGSEFSALLAGVKYSAV